jgi:hypothetical protein
MKKFIVLIFFCAIGFLDFTQAQFLLPSKKVKHILNTQVGYDYNLVSIQLGYQRFFQSERVTFGTDFTQGTALLGSSNLRWRIGTSHWLINSQYRLLKCSADFVLANSKNLAGNYTGIGFDFRLQGGFKLKNKILFAFDFEYNPFVSTYIQHSDYFLSHYLSTAKNGWYKMSSHNLRLGGIVTFQCGKQIDSEFGLRGGYQTSGSLDKLIPGFYAQLLFCKSF